MSGRCRKTVCRQPSSGCSPAWTDQLSSSLIRIIEDCAEKENAGFHHIVQLSYLFFDVFVVIFPGIPVSCALRANYLTQVGKCFAFLCFLPALKEIFRGKCALQMG